MNKRILLLFALIFGFNVINAQECQNLTLYKTNSTCTIPSTTLEAVFLNTNYQTTTDYVINEEFPCITELPNPTDTNIDVDDGWASSIYDIGFTFCFYGNMYDQFIISGNGVVSFDLSIVEDFLDENPNLPPGADGPFHDWYNESFGNLPSTNMQTNAIFGVYCDPDPFYLPPEERDHAIRFEMLNISQIGSRIFVIEYEVPLYGCPGEPTQWLHSKIKLYETSNVIDIEIYQKGDCSGTFAQNGKAIVGIQNKSGTLAQMPVGRDNTEVWEVLGDPNHGGNEVNQELWRFIPDGDALNYSFQWYADSNHDGVFDRSECLYCDQVEADPEFEVPDTIEVRPEEETEYKAELNYQGECSWEPLLPILEKVSVQPLSSEPILHTPNNQYLCEDIIEDECDLTDDNGDCDGDGILNGVDPYPEICDFSDPNGDCDGDSILNGVDPTPLGCDLTDPNADCDGDGILNGVDSTPFPHKAVFNLVEENPLQDFTQNQIDHLFTLIYFYETDEDGDNVMDHVVEIPSDAMTVDQDGNPIALLNYFESSDREIQVLVELNCTEDFDGDGMTNCDDPYPEIACDPTDANDDCDGDGIKNGDDTDPLVYGPCNIDSDSDGMFDCADPNPDSFCDVNNVLDDCDGDGILNGDDAEPLIADNCDPTNTNGDCDNDGLSNGNDPEPLVHGPCSTDTDGDGMFDCTDPDPALFCDVNDPLVDCDGDGIMNGDDTEPLVYGPCNIDTDGDGMFDCADPNPDSFCDVNDPSDDCDGDGILNGDDAEPLIAENCDSTNFYGDCDNDGVINGNCNISDCDLDCDGDDITNCLDIAPSYAYTNCNSALVTFNINVLAYEDTFFEYSTPICSNADNPAPQNLPVYNNPDIITHVYTINNGGVWETPLTGTDPDTGDTFTYSEDGIIKLEDSGDGDDNTGDFTITHTIINNYDDLVLSGANLINMTCNNSSEFTIHIDVFQDASFVYPATACKNDDITDWPMASSFIGTTDFEISTGGIFTDAANGVIDIENTPAGTYTISHTLVNGSCTDTVTHEITIYNTEFNYPNNEVVFCYDSANPVSEMQVGEYTINNGGIIDAATGEIDIQGSYLGDDGSGEFEVTHTINNECSYVLAIKIVKDTSFEFPSEVCYDDTAAASNIAEVGGNFSVENSTATIDSNGVLDLSTTTEGETYTIVYEFTVDGLTCTTTHDVYINITPDATMPVTVLTECNKGDGTAEFDVLSLENEIVGTQSGMTLTFYLTQTDAQDGINAISTSPYARVGGNIWARVESMEGCFNVVEVPLVVEDCYAVLPQAFSPNSDVVANQTFNVANLRETYPDFSISIYNRFGNLVYEGDINTENWNGKLNNDGDLQPAGTYFYGIKLNDEQELQYRGWVYLQE